MVPAINNVSAKEIAAYSSTRAAMWRRSCSALFMVFVLFSFVVADLIKSDCLHICMCKPCLLP